MPKILNLDNPIEDPKINYVRENKAKDIKYALKNAFGFGGVNVSILYKKTWMRISLYLDLINKEINSIKAINSIN